MNGLVYPVVGGAPPEVYANALIKVHLDQLKENGYFQEKFNLKRAISLLNEYEIGEIQHKKSKNFKINTFIQNQAIFVFHPNGLEKLFQNLKNNPRFKVAITAIIKSPEVSLASQVENEILKFLNFEAIKDKRGRKQSTDSFNRCSFNIIESIHKSFDIAAYSNNATTTKTACEVYRRELEKFGIIKGIATINSIYKKGKE